MLNIGETTTYKNNEVIVLETEGNFYTVLRVNSNMVFRIEKKELEENGRENREKINKVMDLINELKFEHSEKVRKVANVKDRQGLTLEQMETVKREMELNFNEDIKEIFREILG